MNALRAFLDLILPPRRGERLVREATLEQLGALARPALIASKPFPTVALLPYPDPLVAGLVKELKFHRNGKALALLSGILADYLAEHLADDSALVSRSYVLVPIPLSPSRARTRGYNQAELLCREAAARLPGVAVDAGLLVRTKDTAPQTELSGARRRDNMQDAFGILHQADPTHTYILIDDVTTTGATLQAAVQALLAAGAIRVMPIALAH